MMPVVEGLLGGEGGQHVLAAAQPDLDAPTIIFADGSRGAGAMPVEAIEQRLAAAKK